MNKSPLLCVLRAGGAEFDIQLALAETIIRPYRIDQAGVGWAKENAVYYRISDNDLLSADELSSAIEMFIAENGNNLRFLRQDGKASYQELDIGLVIDEGMLSRSLTLGPSTLSALAAMDIAYTVSAYVGSEGEG